MKKWDEFYKVWSVEEYTKRIKAWKGLCHRVMRYTKEGGKILEVGFGTGQMSIYIALTKKYDCYGIDNNFIQIKRAKDLAKKLEADVTFMWGDIFNDMQAEFDTVFSQGLLEHFSDEQIKELFGRFFSWGKVVVFSVPLDKFGHQSIGDERLLPENYWLDLCRDYRIELWETFAGGKQLMGVLKNG